MNLIRIALSPALALTAVGVLCCLQVASALMKHATDMSFDQNAPVPENLADLAKAAEDEMKIDAETMAARR